MTAQEKYQAVVNRIGKEKADFLRNRTNRQTTK